MKSLSVCLIFFHVFAASVSAQAAKPNILVIMADDLGFSDLGCYGGEIETPHLDRLAGEGMLFTQFYNNAKCTITRASLLSGMYPRGIGNSIPPDMPTVAEVLGTARYRTALFGKWHLGSEAPQRPIDRGFDHFYGLMDGACNYFDPSQADPAFKGGTVRTFGEDDRLIHEFPEDFYTTDAFTDHAIETVRQAVGAEEPFFIHLAYTAPHYPLHAPAADIDKYRGRYRMGWEALRRERYQRQLAMNLFPDPPALSGTDSRSYEWDDADQEWEDLRMATYAAMVDRMDQNIGRLIAALQESGLADNTLVLFFSDNGGCAEEPGGRDASQEPGIASTYTTVGPAWGWAQNTPFRRYKTWVNEGGIATPMIARWPGKIAPGSTSAAVTHILDVMPTSLELAGLSPEAPPAIEGKLARPLEGRSLVPLLLGRATEDSREGDLCWEWAGNGAIRRGDWKLVWDKAEPHPAWQLFDMSDDRAEMHDVASAHPELVAELETAYRSWLERTERKKAGRSD